MDCDVTGAHSLARSHTADTFICVYLSLLYVFAYNVVTGAAHRRKFDWQQLNLAAMRIGRICACNAEHLRLWKKLLRKNCDMLQNEQTPITLNWCFYLWDDSQPIE